MKNFIYSLKKSNLARNSSISMLTNLINVAVSLISYPVYIHYLGLETYGFWLILGMVISFIQLGNLGIAPAVMKIVAGEYARKDFQEISNYFVSALITLLTASFILFSFSMVFRSHIISLLHFSLDKSILAYKLFPYIVFLSLFLMFSMVVNSFLSGIGRMDVANSIKSVGRIGNLILAFVFFQKGFGVSSLIWSKGISHLLVCILSYGFFLKYIILNPIKKGKIKIFNIKRILSIGSKVCGGSIISMFFHPLNKWIVSYFIGLEAVPIYEIAFNASMQLRNMIEVGFRALLPEIGCISIKKFDECKKEILNLFEKINKLFIFVFFPAYLLVFSLSPWMLKIWLGSTYSISLLYSFRIIFVGTFLSLIGVPYFYTLLGLGRAGDIFLSFSIQSLFSFISIVLAILFLSNITIYIISICVALGMSISTIFLVYRLKFILR